MNTVAKKTLTVGSSALLVVSCAAAAIPEAQAAPVEASGANAACEKAVACGECAAVRAPQVMGTFSFTQGAVDDIGCIARNVAAASKYLCGGFVADGAPASAADEWTVSVEGDVACAYTATLVEMAEDGGAVLTMGCSCAGNDVDGRASANAEVFGATIASIIERAQPSDAVNTVVFACEDGYEVAVPYFYLLQHYSVLAYDLNGEPLANSMGGANQLWLGATDASYFAQDVVSIRFEERETPPVTPGTGENRDAYANVPNVSILSAVEAA